MSENEDRPGSVVRAEVTQPHQSQGGGIVLRDGQMMRERPNGGATVQLTGRTRPHGNGEVITSGRAPSGGIRTGSEISDETIVNIHGMETSVKAGLRAGLIERTPEGQLRVVDRGGRTSIQSQPGQQQQDSRPEPEALAPEVEQEITAVAQKAMASDIQSALNALASGQEVGDDVLGRIASQMSLEPAAAREKFEAIRAAFVSQAEQAIERAGFDPQEVFAYGWEHAPEQMKKAIMAQAQKRTTRGYLDLTRDYLLNLDRVDPHRLSATLEAQGFNTRIVNGRVVIKMPSGMEMEWRSFLRSRGAKR